VRFVKVRGLAKTYEKLTNLGPKVRKFLRLRTLFADVSIVEVFNQGSCS
jgi:hypothetical protein